MMVADGKVGDEATQKEQGLETGGTISKILQLGEVFVNKTMLVEFKRSTFRVITERRRKKQFNA